MPKYQLSIGVIVLSILVPLAITRAAYNDVTLTTDTILTVAGYSLTVSGSSALLESIVVNSANFSITVSSTGSAGSTLIVASAGRKVFTVEGIASTYYTQTCSDTASTLTITVPGSGGDSIPTALITPTATTCTTQTSNNTVSSGGNIGGGTPPAPITTPIVIPAIVPGCPTGVVCTPKSSNLSVVLTSDLSRGSTGADVEKLQKFLAQDKTIYPEGIVNGTFGPATERAVKKFQAKYGLSQVGRVGPATRDKIRSVSETTGTVPPAVPTPTTTPAISVVTTVLTKLLTKGVSNDDVVSLQKILNKDPETRISDIGIGSPGNETNYFGGLTLKAVQKFQVKYGIAKEGDEGYGLVGPKTRAKLNEFVK